MASLGRILYAEDNAVIRTTNVKLLERIGDCVEKIRREGLIKIS